MVIALRLESGVKSCAIIATIGVAVRAFLWLEKFLAHQQPEYSQISILLIEQPSTQQARVARHDNKHHQ